MANFPALRERTGILRTVCLVMSLIALIFIIVALHIHGTDDFIGYEASFADAISITTVSPSPSHPRHLSPKLTSSRAQYVWTILWSFSALCVIVFHGPYHPAVDIALDFIGFGLAWGWAPVVIYWTAYINAPGDCHWSYQGPNFCTRAKALKALEILAGILAITYG